jgi:L-amino acid N-acyltransferase YncA
MVDMSHNGIGAQMLTVLLAEAEAAGYVRYHLSTHHSLHAARSLYRRAGFREVPDSPDFPGIVAGVDICMEMNPVRGTTEESRLA